MKILWEKRRSIARKDEEKEGQERFCARKRSTMRGKKRKKVKMRKDEERI